MSGLPFLFCLLYLVEYTACGVGLSCSPLPPNPPSLCSCIRYTTILQLKRFALLTSPGAAARTNGGRSTAAASVVVALPGEEQELFACRSLLAKLLPSLPPQEKVRGFPTHGRGRRSGGYGGRRGGGHGGFNSSKGAGFGFRGGGMGLFSCSDGNGIIW